jgi:starch synthase (maltosyl-transferring)
MEKSAMDEKRSRVVIENVTPQIDCGRFPIKRTVGERVRVEADIFVDGHDVLTAVLLCRNRNEAEWHELPMEPLVNDRWRGSFSVTEGGYWRYTVQAWVDPFKTWRRDLEKRVRAGQDVSIDILVGARLILEASSRSQGPLSVWLKSRADETAEAGGTRRGVALAMDDELAAAMERAPDRVPATTYEKELLVWVDREKARFSAWYEMFPRSLWPGQQAEQGTFRDCEDRLPYISEMGFDVLYLPPVHPIGTSHRKGKNNSPQAAPGDPGSPWAIGAEAGGHKDVHPRLGTLSDFHSLVEKAGEYGLEIAVDLAYQCSPDHPYVKEHPEWFRRRPDGTVQYAENPPKKYEDIFPIDFDTDHRQELFSELKSVVLFWIEQGVRIFRVDNPHTKPFDFWEWMIREIREEFPDVLFLSEAFTRPKVMYRLAKLGFSHSYTYFTWRNTKRELIEYFSELNHTPVREFFRPNLWPNTPDILPEILQTGGRPAFMMRAVLASTLSANWGIYGPAFELCESRPREVGSEEYLDSEKYEIRHWETNHPFSLKSFIARLNRIRRENPALQSDGGLRFHESDHDQILCYSKHTEDYSNIILAVVNLDPHHSHGAWIHLPLEGMRLEPNRGYQVHDLLGDGRFLWYGPRNFVEIDPRTSPAFVFRIRMRTRTEMDFDYFM